MKKARSGGGAENGPKALDKNSYDQAYTPSSDLANRRVDRPRFQRAVERMHDLGPRALGELLAELNASPVILERYAALTPDMLIATGSTGWPVSVFVIDGGAA